MSEDLPLPVPVVEPVRVLSAEGTCCNRRPLVYKRSRMRFCPRCDRQYDLVSAQQQINFHWYWAGTGFASSPSRASADFAQACRKLRPTWSLEIVRYRTEEFQALYIAKLKEMNTHVDA